MGYLSLRRGRLMSGRLLIDGRGRRGRKQGRHRRSMGLRVRPENFRRDFFGRRTRDRNAAATAESLPRHQLRAASSTMLRHAYQHTSAIA